MTILLTGGTGYLGSNLAHILHEEKKDLILSKRANTGSNRIKKLKEKVNFVDLELPKNYEDILSDIDIVLHTATEYGRNKCSNEVYESNVEFPLKILKYCIDNGCKYFINTDTYFSKSKNYNYLSDYINSKKEFIKKSKDLIKGKKISFVNVRIEHIYGPNDNKYKFVNWLLNELDRGNNINLTEGVQTRDFIYVEDVVHGYLEIIKNINILRSGFNQIDLGTGISTSVKDFVTYAHQITNSKSILNFGSIPYRENELMSSAANTSFMNKISWKYKFGYQDGIEKTIEENKN